MPRATGTWSQDGVRDASGQLVYHEGTVEDISERIAAQEALHSREQQLRLVTSQVPGMVDVVHVSHDGQRTYRFVSPGVRDIFGFGPEDLMADPMLISRYRHPDDQVLLERDLQSLFEGQPDLGGEARVVLPDGRIKWVLRRSSTVSADATGQLRVGVLIDITHRKQAEAALRDSEALWKLALDSSGDGVWDWNLVTGEEHLSPRIKAMFGYGDRELPHLARELDARTHPDDVAQMQIDRAAHFEGRAPIYRNEHRVRCKDGSWKWVLSRGMVIARDDAGQPLRMVGTHTDITELKTAEAQQRALEAQLRESQKMEAIGTLAGGVAHDFNNLLAAILGNLALAREDVGPSRALRLGDIGSGAYVCLSVADNGPGMDAETRRRVFEPFFTTRAPGSGTGLGLSVVHGIVKAHHGAIEVHSAPGEGARFDVFLPLSSDAGSARSLSPRPAGGHRLWPCERTAGPGRPGGGCERCAGQAGQHGRAGAGGAAAAGRAIGRGPARRRRVRA